jgi:hypothetical protein
MDTPNDGERTEHEGLTSQSIDNLLAKRRRKSFPKACYPCRRRKVRCDHNHPCGSCTTLEQPELCVYLDSKGQKRKDNDAPRVPKRPSKARLVALTDLERRMQTVAEEVVRRLGPLNAGLSHGEPLNPHQGQKYNVTDARNLVQSPGSGQMLPPNSPPTSLPAEDIGAPVYIGAESLAAALVDIVKCGQSPENSPQSSSAGGSQATAYETMKLLYMTDTGSTHPFANLWKPGATVEDICLALPDDDTFEQ